MIHLPVSDTGIKVSPLGLGTVKLGRNQAVKYPTSFKLPDDKQVINLLNTAAELGINLLDTAPAYGNSEERLGLLMKKTSADWIVTTKAGEIFDPATGESTYNFTSEFIKDSVLQSMKRLQRDYLDIVLIHSNGDDENIINHFGALDVLTDLKKQGLIRATGMSTKTVEGGILAAKKADVVMATYNLEYQDEKPVIDFARKNNKAIFIKKALSNGHAIIGSEKDPVQKSFDFIYSNKGVTSIILGTINPKHLIENAEKVNKAIRKYR